MSAVRKFWQLGGADQRLLLRAAILLAWYRLALWLLPWRRVSALRRSPSTPGETQRGVDRLEWAVSTASRVIPRGTCLTKALALHHMLSQAGYDSSIHIGVAKTLVRGFEAHAWVEHNGLTLLSRESELAHYSRLTVFQAPSL